jgi:glycosyltransferase involved in cell wall biosynthesis
MVRVTLGSLDLFWFPQLARALSTEATCELFSTWSPNSPPQIDCTKHNMLLLHASLSTYKRLPLLQRGNHVYSALCRMFDAWLARNMEAGAAAVYALSGCCLQAARKARSAGAVTIVESGSTHTAFQHRVVSEEYLRNGIRRPLFPAAYRERVYREFEEADFIQIPSEFVKQTYIGAGVSEKKLLKAAYGADVATFKPRVKSDMTPQFRVICPSGVNLRKGARLLVEAWRKLGWKSREAELHWVGWPGHPDVRHLFRDYLPGAVWHGWMPHDALCDLYRSCDTLVLPSFEEGLARVLIEGAASGLALIATPNTGVEDFFTPENHEGWLIDCGSVDSLCSALEEAKSNRQRTFEIGQRAALRARKGFSWDDYGRQVRENFARVCN